MLAFPDTWWERLLDDEPSDRGGAGELRVAILGDRGFATHRLKSDWDQGVPVGEVQVRDLVATDPEAAAALWGFVLDTDLAGKVVADRRPVDDPLPLLLRDENRVLRQVGWPLYLALVDLPAALSARAYATDETLTLRVHDAFTPGNDGTWRLAARDRAAEVEAVDGPADLELPADVLGALFLGGQRATAYRDAARLVEHTPGAAARFDRMVATEVAAWHGVMF
jgi:predicted acetyltransferase